MKMVPVLDILDGVAVRAVGGVRNEYRPLQSIGCQTPDPVEIALSIRSRFGFNEWYIADLDGIVHRQWNCDLLESLVKRGFSLRVDLGISSIEDLYQVGKLQEKMEFILASESLIDYTTFDLLSSMIDPGQLTFSLDLIEGEMICPEGAWRDRSILEIIDYITRRGLRKVIVLDLAYIGCTKGVGTLNLCRQLQATFPELEIITGGGVRTTKQLTLLEQAGIHTALLGTALHNGQLEPQDLIAYETIETDR